MKLWLMSHPWGCDINYLWLDIGTKHWWYVFIWRRGKWLPFLYRSKDGTPPDLENEGRMIFGRYS